MNMYTQSTHNIEVRVSVFYQESHSKPSEKKFVYAYQVGIHNNREEKVQLLRRHWIVKDSNGTIKEIEGEGVIGEQPILLPGQSHQYNSWVPLKSDIGIMYGTYLMKNLQTDKLFKVEIPPFKLIPTFKYN